MPSDAMLLCDLPPNLAPNYALLPLSTNGRLNLKALSILQWLGMKIS